MGRRVVVAALALGLCLGAGASWGDSVGGECSSPGSAYEEFDPLVHTYALACGADCDAPTSGDPHGDGERGDPHEDWQGKPHRDPRCPDETPQETVERWAARESCQALATATGGDPGACAA